MIINIDDVIEYLEGLKNPRYKQTTKASILLSIQHYLSAALNPDSHILDGFKNLNPLKKALILVLHSIYYMDQFYDEFAIDEAITILKTQGGKNGRQI